MLIFYIPVSAIFWKFHSTYPKEKIIRKVQAIKEGEGNKKSLTDEFSRMLEDMRERFEFGINNYKSNPLPLSYLQFWFNRDLNEIYLWRIIYNIPIYNLIDSYLPDRAVDLTGHEFDDVLKFLKENDTPVVVWATIKMLPVLYGREWIENNTWTTHKWKGNEHSFLLVGYTKDNIIVNDPHTGKQEYYNREIFKQRWEKMGKKAVSIIPEKEEIIETDCLNNEIIETIKEIIRNQFNQITNWKALDFVVSYHQG